MDFFIWRRGRDSNPGNPQRLNGFQDRPIRPLWHLSCFGFRISEIGFQINIRNPISDIRYPRLRRGRDSNPRYPLRYNTLAGCPFQPLRHLSFSDFRYRMSDFRCLMSEIQYLKMFLCFCVSML